MGKKKKDTTIPYDEELLREIAPIGNLKHYDAYSRTGTGFEACVHIFDFPNQLDDFWLQKIFEFQNTIATVSVGTMDMDEVKKNLNRAIEEQGSRRRFAKDYSAYYDAYSREKEMQKLFNEINSHLHSTMLLLYP